MGVAENVARFVIAADNLVNALRGPMPNPVSQAVTYQRLQRRIHELTDEYDEARAAICGANDVP